MNADRKAPATHGRLDADNLDMCIRATSELIRGMRVARNALAYADSPDKMTEALLSLDRQIDDHEDSLRDARRELAASATHGQGEADRLDALIAAATRSGKLSASGTEEEWSAGDAEVQRLRSAFMVPGATHGDAGEPSYPTPEDIRTAFDERFGAHCDTPLARSAFQAGAYWIGASRPSAVAPAVDGEKLERWLSFLDEGSPVSIWSVAAELKAVFATPPAAQDAALSREPVAWQDPVTLDVITDARKTDWMTTFGAGGKIKAATYTVPLFAADRAARPGGGEAQLTPDEMQYIVNNLENCGNGEDFEAECPGCTACAKLRTGLAALPSPAVAGADWQPIETAPKDGRAVLLYRPLAHLTHDQNVDIFRTTKTDRGCWEATVPAGADGKNYSEGYCYATHWMPLPAAPAGSDGTEGGGR